MLPTLPKQTKLLNNKYIGKINYSGFTVGQESIFLQAQDGEFKDQMNAVRQITKECVIEKDFDVDSIPLFALEYLFLKIREISIGEVIRAPYRCKNDVDGQPCNETIECNIKIGDFVIKEYESGDDVIKLSDSISIKLGYPTMGKMMNMDKITENNMLLTCIDYVTHSDEVYDMMNETYDSKIRFLNSLTVIQKKEIVEKFVSKMPHIYYETKFVCPNCGHEHTIKLDKFTQVFR